MEETVLKKKEFSFADKVIFTLLGALTMGMMWSFRGSHGWGSEWGVFTVGMVFLTYVYALFKRKSNGSFFHIAIACTGCILTVPAWGTLLNQTSGYFENSAKEMLLNETHECTPLSGIFIMFCLGIGAIPLYLFILSRLFSEKKYDIVKYAIVIGVFFAVNYLACATVSHWILNAVQPESAAALEEGLKAQNIDLSAYSFYMKHFASINSAKKIDFGRNYFTEISVISKTIATLTTALVVRFGFKDKAGGKIMLWGSLSFGFGITAADIFFYMKNTMDIEKYPQFDYAWGLWEYFTGFISGLLIMIILFAVHNSVDDKNIHNDFVPFIPENVRNILASVVSFALLGFAVIRPFARRLDGNETAGLIAYIIGCVLIAVAFILKMTGKIKMFDKYDINTFCTKAFPIIIALNFIAYFFVGSGDDVPKITDMNIVSLIDGFSFLVIFAVYSVKFKKFIE